MSDTISKDPKRLEEARRLAAEAGASKREYPSLPYDPKAVAREVFEAAMDTRYSVDNFDALWASIVEAFRRAESPIYFAMSEAEYRQAASSFFYLVNARNMQKAAQASLDRADVAKKSLLFAFQDRQKLPVGSPVEPDLLHGVLRKPDLVREQNTCVLHPNGCPPNESAVEFLSAILGLKPK